MVEGPSTPPTPGTTSGQVQVITSGGGSQSATNIPPGILTLPTGSKLNGRIVARDRNGNPILQTSDGNLTLRSKVPLKLGSEVQLQIDENGRNFHARIVTIDGKNIHQVLNKNPFEGRPDVIVDTAGRNSRIEREAQQQTYRAPSGYQRPAEGSPNPQSQQASPSVSTRSLPPGLQPGQPLNTLLISPQANAAQLAAPLLPPGASAGLPAQLPANTALHVTIQQVILPAPPQPTPPNATPNTPAATSGQTPGPNPATPGTPGSIPPSSAPATPSPGAPTTPSISQTSTQTPPGQQPAAGTPTPASFSPSGTTQTPPNTPPSSTPAPPPASPPGNAPAPNPSGASPTPSAPSNPVTTSATPTAIPASTARTPGNPAATPGPIPQQPAGASPPSPSAPAGTPPATPTSPATPASPPAPVSAPPGSLLLTVVGTEKSGDVVVHTPLGTAKLSSGQALPQGTQIIARLNTVTPATLAPATATEEAELPPTPAARLTQAHQTLDEILNVLRQVAPQQAEQIIQQNLPQPGNRLGSSILFFLSALRGGDVQGWLGNQTQKLLEMAGRGNLISQLSRDLAGLRQLSTDNPNMPWQTHFLPIFANGRLEQAHLFVRRDREEEEEKKRQGGGKGSTRFVVEVELSAFGKLQMDGFFRGEETQKSFHLILRSVQRLPEAVILDIRSIFNQTLQQSGVQGSLDFNVTEQFPINPMEEILHEYHNSIIA